MNKSDTDTLVRDTASILSPLRYPGGKRRMVGYIAEALRLSRLRPRLLVEPFAGGASVALQLLNDGLVERIALGEKDPLVASFWKTVFFDHEWLVREVERMKPTLEEWDRYKGYRPRTDRTRALKCLFLNRTSFSGILSDTAGPIGGRKQQSKYTIGCRFPKATIIRRIRQAAQLADRVAFVHPGDWSEVVHKVDELELSARDVLYYMDPPFYFKADRLYRHYFDDPDHQRLRDGLAEIKSWFILSYDAAEPIASLYRGNGHGFDHVEMLYSATRSNGLDRVQELVVTNLPYLPSATRLWRSAGERKNGSDSNRTKQSWYHQ